MHADFFCVCAYSIVSCSGGGEGVVFVFRLLPLQDLRPKPPPTPKGRKKEIGMHSSLFTL